MNKLLLITLLPLSSLATDLQVTDVRLDPSDSSIKATIHWSNAWHNSKNHDAVWLFFKAKNKRGQVNHMSFKRIQPEISESNTQLTIKLSNDSIGVFIYASDSYRGNIQATVRIKTGGESWTALNNLAEIQAYGIEMVYIPEGAFTLGEPGGAYLEYGGLYLSDASGELKGLVEITGEELEIPVAKKDGAMYYQAKTHYEGDQAGIIPASFPNGYSAFYLMKYEPTQGEYVNFLNTLSSGQSQHRANFGGKGYYENRGSIRLEDDAYIADHPTRPNNFMSWDDAMAYADWAGLRPYTELEFVKASRGPLKPSENEFPWNTTFSTQLKRVMLESGDLERPNEKNLSESNRDVYGASYYWVMDLAGSMWERVISIGSEKGRSFVGDHGNGRITGYGFADVDDWPSGVDDSGFGYRGGGFYSWPMNFTEFNPYSPIAYRRYGGWAGGNRTVAYGTRFARTAP